MKHEPDLTEWVHRHAERLLAGEDITAELLAAAGPEQQGALGSVLGLARRLAATLAPQAPPAEFALALKARLVEQLQRPAPRLAAPLRRRALWLAASVGGVASLVGLGILGYRATAAARQRKSGIMAARLAARGAAQAVLPEAQPAP